MNQPYGSPPVSGSPRSFPHTLGVVIALVFLGAALVFSSSRIWSLFAPSSIEPRMITPRGDLAEAEKTTIEIFEQSSPSVAYVTNSGYVRNTFTGQIMLQPKGAGSGFVWDDAGHIVTNYHVIEGTDQQVVTLADQTSWDAVVVGYSKRHDLAILQISAPRSKLVPIQIGRSDDLRVGQAVYAIGNPFGLDQTLTTGVISALRRDIQQSDGVVLRDMIQTDAAINPGNSGGPLIDSAGRLIGVNTAIYSPNQTSVNIGIGFAVPVDVVNTVVPQLIAHGREVRPWIGVGLLQTSDVRMPIEVEGLLIREVYPNSPAQKADLRGIRISRGRYILGDIILAIDGQSVADLDTFNDVMKKYKGGDTITLKIQRGNEVVDIPVTLELVTVDN